MLLEKKRTVAEEEAAYLRTLIENGNKVNPAVLQNERVKELEVQLEEILKDYTTLQTKVSQWARNSKRHQEGRITAESCQRVLEEEVKSLTEQVNDLQKSEILLKDQIKIFQTIGSGDAQVVNLQNSLVEAQMQIRDLEQRLNDANFDLDAFQGDFGSLQSRYDQELQKRIELQNSNETLIIQNQELQDKLNAQSEFSSLSRKRSSFVPPDRSLSFDKNRETQILNHELEAIKQSYGKLQQDHRTLQQTHQEAMRQLELSRQKFFAVEEAMKEQELLVNNIEEMTQERKSLQKQLEDAHDKLKQKQLSIEMLEKHVSNAKNRMAPLQKAAEDYDDLQDEFEALKNHNEDLLEQTQQLKSQLLSYERRVQQLEENIRTPLAGEVI
jgi:chromosome segregation ATPase